MYAPLLVSNKGMYAVVDVSQRTTRGRILMVVDDQQSADEIALELGRRSIDVAVQPMTPKAQDQPRPGYRVPHFVLA